MCWREAFAFACLLFVSSRVAAAGGLILGMGAERDTADSSAYALSADISVGERTWLTGTLVSSETDRGVYELDTRLLSAGLDHYFDPFGVRFGAGAWGKDNFLESTDYRGSLYLSGRPGSLSLDVERRELELTIDSDLLDAPRVVPFSANGVGVSARLVLGDRTSVRVGGMTYDYSRDIALQPRIDLLRLFTLTRLSLMNSLVDYRMSGGIEWAFGDRRLDLLLARWRSAVDQGTVDSAGIGFLTPIGRRADLELRLAQDRAGDFGTATVFSVFVYLFSD
jgi:hypothetical protein